MTIGRQDQDDNLRVVYLINQAMLFRNAATPLSGSISFELLWLASSGTRVYL